MAQHDDVAFFKIVKEAFPLGTTTQNLLLAEKENQIETATKPIQKITKDESGESLSFEPLGTGMTGQPWLGYW
ncbi:hypothetical protein OOZ51_21935 [Arthrobacter sp. MI7-26]|uniref:hypothetical protein n=1 Tax=Arthrobacter sp. MI7-26 TaxID=2993653 RepID=UPI0022494340|nr:hypothetical protein [Arthrobacter sp. MI7-26]MCX2750444.1 hypothetical protein [Arthrobacter sp. MI7-26]